MGIMDSEKGTKSETGEKLPKGAAKADMSGERKSALKNGIGMGKMDSLGMRPMSHAGKFEGKQGEFNEGSKEHIAYEHKRIAHEQDK